MTANKDFKQVVRERMAKTGETYTQARRVITTKTLAKIDKLLADFKSEEGDFIDREQLLVEARNLAATSDFFSMDGDNFYKVFWLLPAGQRLAALGEFLAQHELPTKILTWAFEQRVIHMAMAVHDQGCTCKETVKVHEAYFDWVRTNLDDASQVQAFCTPEVWWCWDQTGRQREILSRMDDCLASIPSTQENKHPRLFIARNLLMYAARESNIDDMLRLQGLLRSILDEPGELPAVSPGDSRLGWEGILQQTPLIAAGDDPVQAEVAAEACASWIRVKQGEADWLMGEVAALCMFQGHYGLAEKYAAEALDAGQGEFNSLIYAWRAGGHLGATGDVASTVPLLVEARRHMSAEEIERLLDGQVPFTEYGDDKRLRDVVSMRGLDLRP